MEVSLDLHDVERGAMGTNRAELPGKVGDPGANASDNRLFVEAFLWIARTGAPWRDLPREFGKWIQHLHRASGAWARKGVWERGFQGLVGRSRLRIRPHRRNLHRVAGAWHRRKRGTSKSGHRLVAWRPDARRSRRSSMRLAIWCASCSCRASVTTSPDLERSDGRHRCLALIGDKAFDADWLRERLTSERHRGGHSAARGDGPDNASVTRKSTRGATWLKTSSVSIKAFRRIATRYEKTDTCLAAMINIVAVILWTR